MKPSAHRHEPESLGKYEIIEEIGRGGYGVVFKGYDPHIKRFVALKTCISEDSEVRQRFHREAEISGRLDHPNVVRIFDCGTENGTPYLVQEYLDGEDLDRKIDKGFLSFPERLLYLIQIARGLAYAHAQGVVHRDIKPSNIRILEDGSAKIMDFGIAKLREVDHTVTQADLTVGTAAYLAPEQIEGDPIDQRTDLFAFGVVAYQLLAGRLPFSGSNLSALFYQTLNHRPRAIRSYSPACPVELERIIERCLEKRPERRLSGTAELLQRLELLRGRLREESRARSAGTRGPAHLSAATIPLRRTGPRQSISGPLGEFLLDADRSSRPPRSSAPPPRRRAARSLVLSLVLVATVAAALWSTEPPVNLTGWLDVELPSLPLPVARDATRTAIEAAPSAVPTVELPLPGLDERAPAPVSEAEAVPASATAMLSFPRAWNPRIRVSVDGSEPMPLGTTLEVEPGIHHVTFSLTTPEYSAHETVRVKVVPDGWRRVSIPLRPPGRLTIQSALGAPQAIVAIDRGRRQTTPIYGRLVGPGGHRVAVYESAGSPEPRLEAAVQVVSGEETVVTFEPGQPDPQVRRRRLPLTGQSR